MLRNLLTNRTAKNATWLIGGKVAQMAINFFRPTDLPAALGNILPGSKK